MKHWFCFTFKWTNIERNQDCTTSVYLHYKKKRVTNLAIEEAKKSAGVTKDSALLACSYLGYMTIDEFVKEPS